MIFNRLSLVAFAIAFIAMAFLFLRIDPLNIGGQNILRFGVMTSGMLGFVFSILSIYFDKRVMKNTAFEKSWLFYVGAFFVMIGALFKIMHYPGVSLLVIGGLLISFVGMIVSKVNRKKGSNDDLLDSD